MPLFEKQCLARVDCETIVTPTLVTITRFGSQLLDLGRIATGINGTKAATQGRTEGFQHPNLDCRPLGS